jgi:hypothetical protein
LKHYFFNCPKPLSLPRERWGAGASAGGGFFAIAFSRQAAMRAKTRKIYPSFMQK